MDNFVVIQKIVIIDESSQKVFCNVAGNEGTIITPIISEDHLLSDWIRNNPDTFEPTPEKETLFSGCGMEEKANSVPDPDATIESEQKPVVEQGPASTVEAPAPDETYKGNTQQPEVTEGEDVE